MNWCQVITERRLDHILLSTRLFTDGGMGDAVEPSETRDKSSVSSPCPVFIHSHPGAANTGVDKFTVADMENFGQSTPPADKVGVNRRNPRAGQPMTSARRSCLSSKSLRSVFDAARK